MDWYRLPIPMCLCVLMGYFIHENLVANNTFWLITDIIVIEMYITLVTVLQYKRDKKLLR